MSYNSLRWRSSRYDRVGVATLAREEVEEFQRHEMGGEVADRPKDAEDCEVGWP